MERRCFSPVMWPAHTMALMQSSVFCNPGSDAYSSVVSWSPDAVISVNLQGSVDEGSCGAFQFLSLVCLLTISLSKFQEQHTPKRNVATFLSQPYPATAGLPGVRRAAFNSSSPSYTPTPKYCFVLSWSLT